MEKEYVVRTFYVSTSKRDAALYPHPSRFQFDLPATLTNVIGISMRNYKFPKETLVNENNKTLSINADNGAIDGSIVIDKGDYDIVSLLVEINTKLNLYGVEFSLDQSANRTVLTFTDTFIQNYIGIKHNSLLSALGYDTGICLRREGMESPASLIGFKVYETSAVAERPYDTTYVSDMIMRITDVETILSNDAVTNRASMILFHDMDSQYTVHRCTDTFLPLLQTQARLQTLRITLLNVNGDLYDTYEKEAVFLIDFYCMRN